MTVSVRFWPLPPNTILALGTNVVEEEMAETTKLDAAVSASLTVKGIAVVVWFKVPARSEIGEIIGAWFPGTR